MARAASTIRPKEILATAGWWLLPCDLPGGATVVLGGQNNLNAMLSASGTKYLFAELWAREGCSLVAVHAFESSSFPCDPGAAHVKPSHRLWWVHAC